MRTLWIGLAVLPLALMFSSCSSAPKARMVEWRDLDLTVCCTQKQCGDKDWVGAAKVHCTGPVSLVGGKVVQGVGGYQTVEKGDKVSLTPVMAEQSCRTFKCDGNVIPLQ